MNTKKEIGAHFMGDVYKNIANGIIASHSVEQTESKEFPDLDAMSNEDIIKHYNIEYWPKYEAKIKVYDTAWLEHLKEATPFSHGFNWRRQPKHGPITILWATLKTSAAYSDFPGADQPPRADSMNKELILSMSSGSKISDEELNRMIIEHELFLNTGGRNGRFELLEAAGLPMNIYLGKSTGRKTTRYSFEKYRQLYAFKKCTT